MKVIAFENGNNILSDCLGALLLEKPIEKYLAKSLLTALEQEGLFPISLQNRVSMNFMLIGVMHSLKPFVQTSSCMAFDWQMHLARFCMHVYFLQRSPPPYSRLAEANKTNGSIM